MVDGQVNLEQRDLEDHIAIGMYIYDDKGDLLSFKHAKWGFWTAPVGKDEEDETTAEEAMLREAREELGIENFDYKKVYNVKATYQYGGRTVVAPLVGFELTNIQEPIQNREPKKHLEFRYRPLGEIATLPFISDNMIMYLNYKGIPHDHQTEGKIAA